MLGLGQEVCYWRSRKRRSGIPSTGNHLRKGRDLENNDVFGGKARMFAEAGGSMHEEIMKRQTRKGSWNPITKAKVKFILKVMGSKGWTCFWKFRAGDIYIPEISFYPQGGEWNAETRCPIQQPLLTFGYWVYEIWLAQTDMCYNHKIPMGLWTLSMKKGMKTSSLIFLILITCPILRVFRFK